MVRSILLALIAAAALSACNTVKGMGRDMSAAGGAVTNEAQEAQRGM
jgi:predicted small secreted protein